MAFKSVDPTKGSATKPEGGDNGKTAFLQINQMLEEVYTDKADGAASSTDNAAARFDGATGKVLQNSALLIADTTGDLSRSGNGGIDIQGTNTNDDAASGQIGEYISSNIVVASAVSLSTGTAKDVTSISLTAGDWDVEGNVGFNPNAATTIAAVSGSISTTTNTNPTLPGGGAYNLITAALTTGGGQILPTGRVRMSLASTTTVYLVATAVFGVNTMGAYGFIGARRVR